MGTWGNNLSDNPRTCLPVQILIMETIEHLYVPSLCPVQKCFAFNLYAVPVNCKYVPILFCNFPLSRLNQQKMIMRSRRSDAELNALYTYAAVALIEAASKCSILAENDVNALGLSHVNTL